MIQLIGIKAKKVVVGYSQKKYVDFFDTHSMLPVYPQSGT